MEEARDDRDRPPSALPLKVFEADASCREDGVSDDVIGHGPAEQGRDVSQPGAKEQEDPARKELRNGQVPDPEEESRREQGGRRGGRGEVVLKDEAASEPSHQVSSCGRTSQEESTRQESSQVASESTHELVSSCLPSLRQPCRKSSGTHDDVTKACVDAPDDVTKASSDGLSKRKGQDQVSGSNKEASKKLRIESSATSSDMSSAAVLSKGNSFLNSSLDTTCLRRHNVRILGSGKTLLFLAHGFGTNQTVWNGVLKHLDLKSTFRVILWDLMGAFSTNPTNYDSNRYSSLHAHADDLLEVLEELKIEKFTYVGHSMSGMIGLLASIECPQKFSRIILLGASCRYLNDPETGYVGGLDVSELDQLFKALQTNYTSWVSGFSSAMVGGNIDSPAVRELSRTLFLLRPDIAFMTLKMVFKSDFRHVLSKVKLPIHIISTQRDEAVPKEVIQYMQENIPQAQVETLELAGHLPHLTHPSLVAELITKNALSKPLGCIQ